jgi:capsular polysaccharide transport system permease protein
MNKLEQPIPVIEDIVLAPSSSKGELVTGEGEALEPRALPFYIRHGLFLVTVVAPIVIATLYFFVIAAPRYYSEAHFIVRSSATSDSSLTTVIENEGLSRANDETYAVDDYLTSRDIVDRLVKNNNLLAILSRPESDFINRYPNFYTHDNKENLYQRFQDMVDADIDTATGISTVQVNAFRAADAHAITVAILKYAEDLINQLNNRAYDDAERYAQSIVDRERAHVREIEEELTQYRNASGTVEPDKEAIATYDMIGKMTSELAMLQADVQLQSSVAPANPSLPAMRERIRSYQAEIDRQKLGIVGKNTSLSTKLAGYENLVMERELAARALGLATVNLTRAREDARQQHLYLQTIVEPNLADEPDYWEPFIGMFIVILVSVTAFSIIRSLAAITLEHTA